MAARDAVADVDEIEMRVDLQNVNVALAIEGLDAGDVDRMIAADHHRQGPARQRCPNARLDVCVAFDCVGVDDVGVAHVDYRHIRTQIDGIVFVVISPRVTEREQRRRLADRARPEPCAGPVLGAEIIGRAQDGNIGVDAGPVFDIRALAKSRDADERQVQAAAVITVIGHGPNVVRIVG